MHSVSCWDHRLIQGHVGAGFLPLPPTQPWMGQLSCCQASRGQGSAQWWEPPLHAAPDEPILPVPDPEAARCHACFTTERARNGARLSGGTCTVPGHSWAGCWDDWLIWDLVGGHPNRPKPHSPLPNSLPHRKGLNRPPTSSILYKVAYWARGEAGVRQAGRAL